jgi:hypothetical protein
MNSNLEEYLPINLQLREIGVYYIRVIPKPFKIRFLDYSEVPDIYLNEFSTFDELIDNVKQELLETQLSKDSIVTILSYLCSHQKEIEDLSKKYTQMGE